MGHLYYFATFQYPQQYGGNALITTPKFLENYLPPYQNTRNTSGFTYIPPNRNTADTNTDTAGSRSFFSRGHQWGSGRRLDD